MAFNAALVEAARAVLAAAKVRKLLIVTALLRTVSWANLSLFVDAIDGSIAWLRIELELARLLLVPTCSFVPLSDMVQARI
jgi:hypothetical protein